MWPRRAMRTCSSWIPTISKFRGTGWRPRRTANVSPLPDSRWPPAYRSIFFAHLDLLFACVDSVHLSTSGKGRAASGPHGVREVAPADLLGDARHGCGYTLVRSAEPKNPLAGRRVSGRARGRRLLAARASAARRPAQRTAQLLLESRHVGAAFVASCDRLGRPLERHRVGRVPPGGRQPHLPGHLAIGAVSIGGVCRYLSVAEYGADRRDRPPGGTGVNFALPPDHSVRHFYGREFAAVSGQPDAVAVASGVRAMQHIHRRGRLGGNPCPGIQAGLFRRTTRSLIRNSDFDRRHGYDLRFQPSVLEQRTEGPGLRSRARGAPVLARPVSIKYVAGDESRRDCRSRLRAGREYRRDGLELSGTKAHGALHLGADVFLDVHLAQGFASGCRRFRGPRTHANHHSPRHDRLPHHRFGYGAAAATGSGARELRGLRRVLPRHPGHALAAAAR